MIIKLRFLFLAFILSNFCSAQEGIPVYSDYFTDNLYLLHPSMAGAANCAKVRLTGRQQWFGQENAPSLQTASFNGRIGEQSGAGIILFNDNNGFHAQRGVKLTYAHHIMFSRDELDLNQLSFGINAGMSQRQLDESSFLIPDPIIGGILQNNIYYNFDIGASYNFLDFYAHFTVKNVLPSKRDIYTDIESNNLRRFIFSSGFIFGDRDGIQLEPSTLFQLVDKTREKIIDLNLKAYKEVDFGKLWAGVSYRRAFDAAQFTSGGVPANQRLQYVTPVVGVNYKKYMVAYTYSHIAGNVRFDQSGFHQITIGLNIFCKPEKYSCNCPAVN